ncbi:MAG: hypothetical protein U0892_16450 [Pirellulales bacterium]
MLSSIVTWWNTQSLGRWPRSRTVLVFTCRIQVLGNSPHGLRFHFLCSNRLYADAEHAAEDEAFRLLKDRGLKPGPDCAMKWNKGRFITQQTLKTESESVIELLKLLRSGREPHVSSLIQSSSAAAEVARHSKVA